MTQVRLISDPAEYFDLRSSDKVNVTNASFINDEIIEIHYENTDEFIETSEKTNVVIAAFTTTHARLKLYGVLEQLDRRVLYFDTDSIIYVSNEDDLGTADRFVPRWADRWIGRRSYRDLCFRWTKELCLPTEHR